VTPTTLLANNAEYFELLFSLLTHTYIDNAAVWELICMLPFNQQRERELYELRDTLDWTRLFDASHTSSPPYQLLYTLQIINHHMLPSLADTSPVQHLSSSSLPHREITPECKQTTDMHV
jgi:hypothetical protein